MRKCGVRSCSVTGFWLYRMSSGPNCEKKLGVQHRATEKKLACPDRATTSMEGCQTKEMWRGQLEVAVMVPSWHLTCTPLRRYIQGGTEQPWARTSDVGLYIWKHIYVCEHGVIPQINKYIYIYTYICIWPIYMWIKNVFLCWKETDLGTQKRCFADKHPTGPKMQIPNIDQRSVQKMLAMFRM